MSAMNRLDVFYSERSAAVWHAYETLQDGRPDALQKSRLKVLTSNLSNALSSEDLGARLDEYTDDATITFEDYSQFLLSRLYCLVADSQKPAWTAFEHVCWVVLSAKAPELVSQPGGYQSNADRECGFQLWRIFNFLAERDPKQFTVVLPPQLNLEEAKFIDERLDALLGVSAKQSSSLTASQSQAVSLTGNTGKQYSSVEEELLFGTLTFAQYARYVRARFLVSLGVAPADFSRAVDELHAQMLDDVVKRGMLGEYKETTGIKLKSGTTVKERYAVLTRSEFRLFDTREAGAQSEPGTLKHSFVLSERVRVEPQNELTSSKHATQFRFMLTNEYAKKRLSLVTADLRSRNEWIAAFALANQHRDADRSIAAIEAHARLTDRWQRRAEYERRAMEARREQLALEQSITDLQNRIGTLHSKLDDEEKKRKSDANRAKMTEEELRKKMEAEAALKARIAEQEANLKNLEAIRRELEALLEVERNAKLEADEQQAELLRTLEEEQARRAALERLNGEMRGLLSNEAKQRGALESQRAALEAALRAEAERLRQLEDNQRTIRSKLEQARARLVQAEADKQALTNARANFSSHRGMGAFCEADFSRKPVPPTLAQKPANTQPR